MPEPKKKKRSRNQAPKPRPDAVSGNGSVDPLPTPEDAEAMERSISQETVKTGAPAGGPVAEEDREIVVKEHNGRGVAQLLHDPDFIN